MTKTPRTTRRRGTPFALQARDLDLLTVIGLCRFISVEQLAHTFFPSPDRARRRVRQLFDAGLVDMTMVTSTAPSLVSLARAGRVLLRDQRPELGPRLDVARAPALHTIPHHLLIVELRLFLARLMTDGQLDHLRVDHPPSDPAGWRRYGLVPDATATIGLEDEVRELALEADTGSEGRVVVAAKLAKYRRAFADGRIDGIVVAVEDMDACRRIEGFASEVGLADSVVVLSTSAARSEDAVLGAGRLWRMRAP